MLRAVHYMTNQGVCGQRGQINGGQILELFRSFIPAPRAGGTDHVTRAFTDSSAQADRCLRLGARVRAAMPACCCATCTADQMKQASDGWLDISGNASS